MTLFTLPRPSTGGSEFFPAPPRNVVPRERVYPRVFHNSIPLPRTAVETVAAYAFRFSISYVLQRFQVADPGQLTMAEITKEVALKYGVSKQEIFSKRRFRTIVEARQEAMWRCYEETEQALTAIGRFFHKDHTTVLHAVDRMKALGEHG